MSDKTYNGHKNWNYWNVALWLGNDEGLYNMAREAYRSCGGNARKAAEAFVGELAEHGITKTPDGAEYTKAAVAVAIAGLHE